MENHSEKRRYWGLLVVILLVAAYGFYYHYSGESDKRLADQVYQEMVTIDGQLDSLQQTAQQILQQKKLNDQIINQVSLITPDNYAENSQKLTDLINQVNYNKVTQSKFESAITLLNSEVSQPKSLKHDLKMLKITTRELKYQHNQEVNQFNQQITIITNQVSNIKDQISHIHTDKLQELELAKLKFISKKLSETAHSLQAAFYASLVDDVINTVIDDAESSK